MNNYLFVCWGVSGLNKGASDGFSTSDKNGWIAGEMLMATGFELGSPMLKAAMITITTRQSSRL